MFRLSVKWPWRIRDQHLSSRVLSRVHSRRTELIWIGVREHEFRRHAFQWNTRAQNSSSTGVPFSSVQFDRCEHGFTYLLTYLLYFYSILWSLRTSVQFSSREVNEACGRDMSYLRRVLRCPRPTRDARWRTATSIWSRTARRPPSVWPSSTWPVTRVRARDRPARPPQVRRRARRVGRGCWRRAAVPWTSRSWTVRRPTCMRCRPSRLTTDTTCPSWSTASPSPSSRTSTPSSAAATRPAYAPPLRRLETTPNEGVPKIPRNNTINLVFILQTRSC